MLEVGRDGFYLAAGLKFFDWSVSFRTFFGPAFPCRSFRVFCVRRRYRCPCGSGVKIGFDMDGCRLCPRRGRGVTA